MAKKKTILRTYAAWEYGKEIYDLNERSKNGWQLKKGGNFHSNFVEDNDVVYRYQLDYNTIIDDKGRYVETFAEQGWEYINSTYNNWHYFRKRYDPSLPESEYEIYTDKQSHEEMARRWSKIGIGFGFFGIFILIMETYSFIKAPGIQTLILILLYLILTPMLFYGGWRMKKAKVERGRSLYMVIAIVTLLTALILLAIPFFE